MAKDGAARSIRTDTFALYTTSDEAATATVDSVALSKSFNITTFALSQMKRNKLISDLTERVLINSLYWFECHKFGSSYRNELWHSRYEGGDLLLNKCAGSTAIYTLCPRMCLVPVGWWCLDIQLSLIHGERFLTTIQKRFSLLTPAYLRISDIPDRNFSNSTWRMLDQLRSHSHSYIDTPYGGVVRIIRFVIKIHIRLVFPVPTHSFPSKSVHKLGRCDPNCEIRCQKPDKVATIGELLKQFKKSEVIQQHHRRSTSCT